MFIISMYVFVGFIAAIGLFLSHRVCFLWGRKDVADQTLPLIQESVTRYNRFVESSHKATLAQDAVVAEYKTLSQSQANLILEQKHAIDSMTEETTRLKQTITQMEELIELDGDEEEIETKEMVAVSVPHTVEEMSSSARVALELVHTITAARDVISSMQLSKEQEATLLSILTLPGVKHVRTANTSN